MFILDTLFKMKENLEVSAELNSRASKKFIQEFFSKLNVEVFSGIGPKAVKYMGKLGTTSIKKIPRRENKNLP